MHNSQLNNIFDVGVILSKLRNIAYGASHSENHLNILHRFISHKHFLFIQSFFLYTYKFNCKAKVFSFSDWSDLFCGRVLKMDRQKNLISIQIDYILAALNSISFELYVCKMDLQ